MAPICKVCLISYEKESYLGSTMQCGRETIGIPRVLSYVLTIGCQIFTLKLNWPCADLVEHFNYYYYYHYYTIYALCADVIDPTTRMSDIGNKFLNKWHNNCRRLNAWKVACSKK